MGKKNVAYKHNGVLLSHKNDNHQENTQQTLRRVGEEVSNTVGGTVN
jgi:hypothetical protein